jgi:hypothetical protein
LVAYASGVDVMLKSQHTKQALDRFRSDAGGHAWKRLGAAEAGRGRGWARQRLGAAALEVNLGTSASRT